MKPLSTMWSEILMFYLDFSIDVRKTGNKRVCDKTFLQSVLRQAREKQKERWNESLYVLN